MKEKPRLSISSMDAQARRDAIAAASYRAAGRSDKAREIEKSYGGSALKKAVKSHKAHMKKD